MVDTDPPASPVEPVEEDDGTWATGRGGRGFEAAMAYYWIDYAQRLIQSSASPTSTTDLSGSSR